jgi:hypothetical protein
MIVIEEDKLEKLISHPKFIGMVRAIRTKNVSQVNAFADQLKNDAFDDNDLMLALAVIDERIKARNKLEGS